MTNEEKRTALASLLRELPDVLVPMQICQDAAPEQKSDLRETEKGRTPVLSGKREIPDRQSGSDRLHHRARR